MQLALGHTPEDEYQDNLRHISAVISIFGTYFIQRVFIFCIRAINVKGVTTDLSSTTLKITLICFLFFSIDLYLLLSVQFLPFASSHNFCVFVF
jgi:nitrate reductase NapE component